MAFGNLKFDTLTTSDAKNTNTEKSLDTSYIFNGVAKGWTHFQGTSTAASIDGFNISSIDDDGTGDYGLHLTNNMSNAVYAGVAGTSGDGVRVFGLATSKIDRLIGISNTGSVEDGSFYTTQIDGDLA